MPPQQFRITSFFGSGFVDVEEQRRRAFAAEAARVASEREERERRWMAVDDGYLQRVHDYRRRLKRERERRRVEERERKARLRAEERERTQRELEGWLVVPGVYVGSRLAAENVDWMRKEAITAVVNVSRHAMNYEGGLPSTVVPDSYVDAYERMRMAALAREDSDGEDGAGTDGDAAADDDEDMHSDDEDMYSDDEDMYSNNNIRNNVAMDMDTDEDVSPVPCTQRSPRRRTSKPSSTTSTTIPPALLPPADWMLPTTTTTTTTTTSSSSSSPEEEEDPDNSGVVLPYLRIAVGDAPDEPLYEHFFRISAFVRAHVEKGGRVLVHCKHGRSRSVAALVAYLMIEAGKSLLDAEGHMREVRPNMAINFGFLQQLCDFERRLHPQWTEGSTDQLKASRSSRSVRSILHNNHGGHEEGMFPEPVHVTVMREMEEEEEEEKEREKEREKEKEKEKAAAADLCDDNGSNLDLSAVEVVLDMDSPPPSSPMVVVIDLDDPRHLAGVGVSSQVYDGVDDKDDENNEDNENESNDENIINDHNVRRGHHEMMQCENENEGENENENENENNNNNNESHGKTNDIHIHDDVNVDMMNHTTHDNSTNTNTIRHQHHHQLHDPASLPSITSLVQEASSSSSSSSLPRPISPGSVAVARVADAMQRTAVSGGSQEEEGGRDGDAEDVAGLIGALVRGTPDEGGRSEGASGARAPWVAEAEEAAKREAAELLTPSEEAVVASEPEGGSEEEEGSVSMAVVGERAGAGGRIEALERTPEESVERKRRRAPGGGGGAEEANNKKRRRRRALPTQSNTLLSYFAKAAPMTNSVGEE